MTAAVPPAWSDRSSRSRVAGTEGTRAPEAVYPWCMHRAAASVTLLLFLALAAPAAAKELSAARACDADRCNTVTSRSELRALMDQNPAAAPERRAPFHRVRMTISDPDGSDFHYTVAYVPALKMVREQPSTNGEWFWTEPSPRAIAVLDRLARGLEPIPARRLRGIAPATASAPAPASSPSPPADGGGRSGARWLLVLTAPALIALGWAVRRRRPWLRPKRA
jgi:hypothetical protein